MNSYLPKVDPSIGGSLEHEIKDKDDIQYIKMQMKRINAQNPVIAKFILEFSKLTKDRKGAAFCAILIYRMLESQAEADKMLEDFNLQ